MSNTLDPTDNALAAIASMLDQSEAQAAETNPPAATPAPPPPDPAEAADGYAKIGPGPIEALRFQWRVRRDGDAFYVDETIGPHSRPLTTGPMSAAEAMRFVDAQDRDARFGYEDIRVRMTSFKPADVPPSGDNDA